MSDNKDHASVKQYTRVAVILGLITWLEVDMPNWPMQWVFTFGLLVLAIVKFNYVVQVFMHLKYDNKFFTVLLFFGLFLAIGTISALMKIYERDFTQPSVVVQSASHDGGNSHSGDGGEAEPDLEECLERIPVSLEITASDPMNFDKDSFIVPSCSTVTLTLINSSNMEHNFVLIEEGKSNEVGIASVGAGPLNNYVPEMDEVLFGGALVKPNVTETFTFDSPPVGEYEFLCTFPGHYVFMKGSFTVE